MLPHVTAATRGLPGSLSESSPNFLHRPSHEGPAGFLHHLAKSRTSDPGTLDLLRKADWRHQPAAPQPQAGTCLPGLLRAAGSLHRKGPALAEGSESLAALHAGVPEGPRGLAAAINRSAVPPPPPRPTCWGGPGVWMTPTALQGASSQACRGHHEACSPQAANRGGHHLSPQTTVSSWN